MLFITMTYLQVNNKTIPIDIARAIIEIFNLFNFLYSPTLLYHQSSIPHYVHLPNAES